MKKVIFLISGNGGNFKFVNICLKKNILENLELIIIADRSCKGLEYCKNNRIKNYLIDYNRENNKQLLDILKKENPDIIITNWYKIIDEKIVKEYKNQLINLHYSILPSFSGYIGEKPLKLAIEKGCKFFGTTLHHVDEIVDNGEIINQSIYRIEKNIEKNIENSFKAGCYQLLNLLINNDKKEIGQINNIYFNPLLSNKVLKINETIWKEVRNS